VREIDRTVLGNDSIPSALVRRYLCNQAELAGSVNSGDRKPRILGSAYIQQVSGRRVVEVIHAVAAQWDSFRLPGAQVVWCDLGQPLRAPAADAWAWLYRVLAACPLTVGMTCRLPAPPAPAAPGQ